MLNIDHRPLWTNNVFVVFFANLIKITDTRNKEADGIIVNYFWCPWREIQLRFGIKYLNYNQEISVFSLHDTQCLIYHERNNVIFS